MRFKGFNWVRLLLSGKPLKCSEPNLLVMEPKCVIGGLFLVLISFLNWEGILLLGFDCIKAYDLNPRRLQVLEGSAVHSAFKIPT